MRTRVIFDQKTCSERPCSATANRALKVNGQWWPFCVDHLDGHHNAYRMAISGPNPGGPGWVGVVFTDDPEPAEPATFRDVLEYYAATGDHVGMTLSTGVTVPGPLTILSVGDDYVRVQSGDGDQAAVAYWPTRHIVSLFEPMSYRDGNTP